jgi:hypothetical protein
MLSSLLTAASAVPFPLAAQSATTNSYAWGIVIFCVVVGLIVTLKSAHRSSEVKRPKQE